MLNLIEVESTFVTDLDTGGRVFVFPVWTTRPQMANKKKKSMSSLFSAAENGCNSLGYHTPRMLQIPRLAARDRRLHCVRASAGLVPVVSTCGDPAWRCRRVTVGPGTRSPASYFYKPRDRPPSLDCYIDIGLEHIVESVDVSATSSFVVIAGNDAETTSSRQEIEL